MTLINGTQSRIAVGYPDAGFDIRFSLINEDNGSLQKVSLLREQENKYTKAKPSKDPAE